MALPHMSLAGWKFKSTTVCESSLQDYESTSLRVILNLPGKEDNAVKGQNTECALFYSIAELSENVRFTSLFPFILSTF
jgi:hypothetical protein